MTASSSPSTEVVARENGRFAKGHVGIGGRPKQLIIDYQRSLEQIVREHITADKVRRILNKLVEQAESGDTKAAKLLLDKIIPNAVPDAGDQDPGRVVIFKIENATFAAKQQERLTDAGAIDAEIVSEVQPVEASVRVCSAPLVPGL